MRSGSQTIPPEASKANSNPTALIIGDASDFRQQCIALFEKAGYDVATAAEAKTAIEALAQRTFGVVLVDCDPVDIDGLRLLDRIKGLAPRTAVILASSAPGVDEAVAAIRQGAADYLVKPVDPERIAAWIQIRENAC